MAPTLLIGLIWCKIVVDGIDLREDHIIMHALAFMEAFDWAHGSAQCVKGLDVILIQNFPSYTEKLNYKDCFGRTNTDNRGLAVIFRSLKKLCLKKTNSTQAAIQGLVKEGLNTFWVAHGRRSNGWDSHPQKVGYVGPTTPIIQAFLVNPPNKLGSSFWFFFPF